MNLRRMNKDGSKLQTNYHVRNCIFTDKNQDLKYSKNATESNWIALQNMIYCLCLPNSKPERFML